MIYSHKLGIDQWEHWSIISSRYSSINSNHTVPTPMHLPVLCFSLVISNHARGTHLPVSPFLSFVLSWDRGIEFIPRVVITVTRTWHFNIFIYVIFIGRWLWLILHQMQARLSYEFTARLKAAHYAYVKRTSFQHFFYLRLPHMCSHYNDISIVHNHVQRLLWAFQCYNSSYNIMYNSLPYIYNNVQSCTLYLLWFIFGRWSLLRFRASDWFRVLVVWLVRFPTPHPRTLRVSLLFHCAVRVERDFDHVSWIIVLRLATKEKL